MAGGGEANVHDGPHVVLVYELGGLEIAEVKCVEVVVFVGNDKVEGLLCVCLGGEGEANCVCR